MPYAWLAYPSYTAYQAAYFAEIERRARLQADALGYDIYYDPNDGEYHIDWSKRISY